MSKTIELSKGYVAIIDDDDFERVNYWKWSAAENKYKNRNIVYARRTDRSSEKDKTIMLHRFIANAPEGVEVDHKNGNGLDCRKSNLRTATHSQNQINSFKPRKNKTGFRGVGFDKRVKKSFYARININNQNVLVGYFNSAEEAARAYDAKAKELHGEFAYLNFPA